MQLSRIGEFSIIERIRKIIGKESDQVVTGIGDDAAVIKINPGFLCLITTDALIEGVHFDLSYTPFHTLGWKAMAVNISDIAAMGGIPKTAVICLALTNGMKTEDLDALYQGINECGEEYNCTTVGGDIVKSNSGIFLSITITGEVEEDCLVLRSGAKKGDLICVTGQLGSSLVGLKALSSTENIGNFLKSKNRFLKPEPRLREARLLASKIGINSMIDISDGLASEIHHICRNSDTGCRIYKEKIPVTEEMRLYSQIKGTDPVMEAVGSGEEYELLFTISKENYKKLEKFIPFKNCMISVIGEISEKKNEINLISGNKISPLKPKGWDHLKN